MSNDSVMPAFGDSQQSSHLEGGQLNIPPAREGGLWKVITSALRCPACGSRETKANTGKRENSQGLQEHYRECAACHLRFRVIQE